MNDNPSPSEVPLAAASIQQKVNTLNKAAWQMRHRDPDRARLLCQEALALSDQHGYRAGLAASRYRLGQLLLHSGDYPQAYRHTLQAVELYESLKNRSGLMRALATLGEISRQQAKTQQLNTVQPARETRYRQQLEEELHRRAIEMTILAEVGRQVNASLELPTLLKRALIRARELLQADNAAIMLDKADQKQFSTLLAFGPDAEAIKNFVVVPGQGILGMVAQTGQAQSIDNTANDSRSVQIPGTDPPNEALMGAPLMARNRVIGLMVLWRRPEIGPFASPDLDFLVALARQAAIAIENARLFYEAKRARIDTDVANKTKNVFLAKMSHELRTPLNSILGFAQLLSRNPSLDAAAQDTLKIIRRSSEHLLTLINDVLDYAKLESGQVTLNERDLDLYKLLDNLEEMFQLQAEEKQLQLKFSRAGRVPQYIRTDEAKLRQVLINLIGNAIKFTGIGEVAVHVSRAKFSGAPNSLMATHYAQLHFEVKDSGPGIAPEEMGHLFEAFVQTRTGRQAVEGTGLGLAVSHQFVQMMGGKLSVDSRLGQGTTFAFDITVGLVHHTGTLTLPAQPAKNELTERPSPETDHLQRLPSDIRQQLKQAARQTDIDQINRLIEQTRSLAPEAAQVLTGLAYNFEYDKILALLGTGNDD